EVGGIGLNEVGVELMLPNELAEPVANPRAIAVAAVPVCRLRRNFLDFIFRFASSWQRSGQHADLFHRADPNAVGLPQSAVDGAGLGHTHFGTANERRDVRRIGVAVAYESAASTRSKHCGFKCPSGGCRVAESRDWSYLDTG